MPVVRQFIRGSREQCCAEAPCHHGGHNSRLAALLLQELQVELGGHSDLIARLPGGVAVRVHVMRLGWLSAGCTSCELEVGQLTILSGAATIYCAITALQYARLSCAEGELGLHG